MNFEKLAAARRSVRAYRPDPVPEPLLRQVLEAARLAPSACNRQPFRIVVAVSDVQGGDPGAFADGAHQVDHGQSGFIIQGAERFVQ